jgi:GTP cyclohydrolase I
MGDKLRQYEYLGDSLHSIGDSIRHMITFIGDDPNREGLKETPNRIVGSWTELYSGYNQEVEDLFTIFEDGACDEMVLLKDIEFFSTCEHHMLPFFGTAHIAYIPNGKVIGISKLARVLEVYSRRLQIQERIGQQVTAALDEYLDPKGSACILSAKHLCMTCRGVNKQNSVMVTSSLTRGFKLNPAARAELMALIGGV